MLKILHASDLHYSPGNLVEAEKCFGHAVEQAIANNVALAMLTGDLTDHALDGHSPALLALAKRIKQLADHCPVFMLQGTFSHEPVGLLKMLEMIGARHPIIVSDKIGMIGLSEGKWMEYDPTYSDVKYDLVITSVPTVNKAELALVVGADNASVEMGNHLAALLGLFGPANAALRRQGVPTVLASHGTVDGSLNESGVPMAGLDHEFSLGALFSANTSATMLGHIHMHQQWTREHEGRVQRIAYPGSVGRYHYGELGEKYCLIWEVSADTADFTPVQTPSKRMIEIAFEGVPNLDELATITEQCRGAFVRVRYSVDEEFAKTIDRQAIKQILSKADAIIEAIKRELVKHKLELLQRYPKDLEIDKAMLERFAHPGVKFAWCVGDSHTHLAPLGLHRKHNEVPTYVTRLANNDRFYVLSVGHGPAQFTLKEIERDNFSALVHTPIPYKMIGSGDSFWLYRNESRVGTCIVTREGTFEKPVYKIALTAIAGISNLDRQALEEWGQQAAVKKAGSLFAHSQVEWQDEIKLQLAA